MTIKCAWCKITLTKDYTRQGHIISWDICDHCADKLKKGDFEHVKFHQPWLDRQHKT